MTICAREGCENSLEGMRSQARWCSEWCRSRQRYADAKETRRNPVQTPHMARLAPLRRLFKRGGAARAAQRTSRTSRQSACVASPMR